MHLRLLTAVLLVGAFTAPAAIWADKTVRRPHVDVQLISSQHSVQPNGAALMGVRFVLEPHWHIYWLNPGDSGEPTRVDWTVPEGWEAGPLQWPTPSRIPVDPLVNYGYENEVTLLTELQVGDAPMGSEATVEAHVSWLVCKEICIPGEATLRHGLRVTAHPGPPSRWATLLAGASATLPKPHAEWRARASIDTHQITWTVSGPVAGISTAEFFPYSESVISPSAPQQWTPDSSHATLRLTRSPLSQQQPLRGDDLKGVLVLHGDTPTAVEITPTLESPWSLWIKALLFALVGGALLNLMPCVFPVLCIKVLSFVQMGGANRRHNALHAGAYTAGILVCFWLLAGTLLLLRSGGQALGWGFQLQSPGFLIGLSFVLLAFALNLFGVFEIQGAWMGVGQKLTARRGLPGAFFSGVLATVVATPCTAPFMGTAMGYALSQPAFIGLGVFTALGLGLALPYALLALFPALTRWLPQPGRWMVIFKQFIAFPLVLTVWWLLSVLALQTSAETVFQVLAACIVFAMGLWVFGLQTKRHLWRRIVSALLIASALAWAFTESRRAQHSQSLSMPQDGWQPYTEAELKKARLTNRPVFIDFTAAWCITCQVNKRVALNTDRVQKRFAEKEVLLFRADWTHQNAEISKKLESFGRNGVPLYVLYPGGPDSAPRILPEILTPEIVLNALDAL